MANFETLKTAIDANINTNGKQAITGSVVNNVMHQMVDATSEQLTELESNLYNIRFIGDDNNFVSKSVNLVPNRTYEIYIVKDWKLSVPNNKFRVSYFIDGIRTDKIVTSEVKSSYTIKTIECDNNNEYTISVRADKGEQVFLLIEDVTDTTRLLSNTIVHATMGETSSFEQDENGNSLINISYIGILLKDGEYIYRSALSFVLNQNQNFLILNYSTNEIETSSTWRDKNCEVLLEYNEKIVGGLIFSNVISKGEYESICVATSIQFGGENVSWSKLSLRINGVNRVFDAAQYVVSPTQALIYDSSAKNLVVVSSISEIQREDIILLYNRPSYGYIAGLLLPYYNSAILNNNNDRILVANNVTFNDEQVSWDSLVLKIPNKSNIQIEKGAYQIPVSNMLLYRESTNTCEVISSLSYLDSSDVVLLYRRDSGYIAGLLIPYYQRFLENNRFKNDAELNVFRKAHQMLDIEWTPKKDVLANEGLHKAGVKTKSIPYSSVKEKLKFVGRDVSFHTFMTAVNDEHSLLYTENVSEENSESAYGLTYHGTNCISYFGNVCSAFVGSSLGITEALNSWEILLPQNWEAIKDEHNLEVGDVLHEPGHCSVVTYIERNERGGIRYIYLSEQMAASTNNACITTRYTPRDLRERRISNNGCLARYKRLSDNVFFKNVPFALPSNEYLYSKGDIMFLDNGGAAKYYRCIVANSDSEFDDSKWREIEKFSQSKSYVFGDYCYNIRRGYNYIYRLKVNSTLGAFSFEEWEEYTPFEWSAFPYVYNNDIVTFAGDRASFVENDLVYINYNKGNYTHMEIYKDEVLIQTLPLDDHYQMNISSYVAECGMYKARLSSASAKSRFTYFEVLDTQIAATRADGYVKVEYSSSNAMPIQIQCVKSNFYPLFMINGIENGSEFMFNPAYCTQAEHKGYEYDGEAYVRLIVKGVYGNVASEKISIGELVTTPYEKVIRDGETINLGEVVESQNIILDGSNGNYVFSMYAEIEGIKIDVHLSQGIIYWSNRLPESLEPGARYQVSVIDGIGNVTIAY